MRLLMHTLVAVAALVGITANALAACNVEISAGWAITDDKLSSGSTIDLSQTGALAGAGAGCDLIGGGLNAPFVGVLGRYSVMSVVGDLGGASIKSDQLWEAAARVGYKWHDKYAPYVLVGWSGMNLDLPAGLGSKQPNGFMAGAGMDAHISGPWWMRGEYTFHDFAKQDVSGASLQPNLSVVRAAIVYQFGAAPADQKPLK